MSDQDSQLYFTFEETLSKKIQSKRNRQQE